MPSAPEPPINVPRIAQVLSPGDGLYSVYVRMPYNLASKVPDKAWNLTITEIGLAPKDAEKFAGYVLVGFESMKGSPDILWVFESLPGAVWDTVTNSRDNLTPAKFKSLVTTTKLQQDVLPGTEPDTLTSNQVLSSVERQQNSGKSVKTDVTEEITENTSLMGEQFAPDGVILAVSESLVVEGTASDAGFEVESSVVDSLGNGKSVKQTRTPKTRNTSGTVVAGWSQKQKKQKGVENLTPEKYRALTTTDVVTTQVTLAAGEVNDIPDPATPTGDVITVIHEKVNDYRYQRQVIEEVIDENAEPLVGEEYGDIVTREVSEELVVDGTDADTGINVISSVVDPLGNGKSVKVTKTAKGGWPDPVESEKSKEIPDLIPAKFRESVVRTKTTSKLAVGSIPGSITLTGDEVGKTYKKETPDRAELTTTSEVIAVDASPLEGEALNRYGTVSTIAESLVEDATALPTPDYLTLKSSDTPLGNGKSVREVETVDAFPELTGFKTDNLLQAPVKFTEEIVDASTALTNTDPLVEYEPIDALRTMKRTDVVPTAFLDSYVQSFPKRTHLDIPRELVGVNIVWGSSSNVGSQDGWFVSTTDEEEYSIGGNISDDANSSASVSPEIQLNFRNLASESLFSTVYSFFMEMPVTTAGVLARLSSIAGATSQWPVFHPESHTITATSQAVGVRVSAQAATNKRHTLIGDTTNAASGTSDDIQCSIGHSSVEIPPCIHGSIAFTGGTSMVVPVTALAVCNITGAVSASAVISRSGTASGSVSPTFLSATSGQNTVPTSGQYLIDLDVEPYKWGYAMVKAEVFDAANLV